MSRHVKTWEQRMKEAGGDPRHGTAERYPHLIAEVDELRTALASNQAEDAPEPDTDAVHQRRMAFLHGERERLASCQGVAVPAGWALVPVEPTDDMRFATTHINNLLDTADVIAMLRAAIAAAPQPPAVKEAAPAPATLSLTESQRRAASLFGCWWSMVQAERELAETPIDPEAVVLHFMGCGASCMVHAKDLTEISELMKSLLAAAGNSQGLDGGSHG